jgi:hypothetical protein
MFKGGSEFQQIEQVPKPRSFWASACHIVPVTEGASYAAINTYDQAIFSFGLLQWAGAIGNNSPLLKVLGRMWVANSSLLVDCLREAIDLTGVKIDYNIVDKLLVIVKKDGTKVKTPQDWCDVFNGGVSGKLGSWTAEAKSINLVWCNCFIKVAQQEVFRKCQYDELAHNLPGTYFKNFILFDKDTKTVRKPTDLLQYKDDKDIETWDIYRKGLLILFVSYAANNPLNALNKLYQVVPSGSMDWKGSFYEYAYQCGMNSSIQEWKDRLPKILEEIGKEWPALAGITAATIKDFHTNGDPKQHDIETIAVEVTDPAGKIPQEINENEQTPPTATLAPPDPLVKVPVEPSWIERLIEYFLRFFSFGKAKPPT